ncbi:MAG: VCBS repeat-containing protein, partial [Myxococcales bacterium]|nr:VCBS repeat-containing protein [Myxococcales bacterium]
DSGLAAGDLDDDGVAELVVGDADGGLVFALGATPTRAARLLGVAPLPLYTPHTLALVDVSGDELLDLAVTGLDDPRVLISEGDGAGGFRLPHVVEFDAPVDQLGVADLNGDGAPDLVAGTFSEQRVTVRLADP